MFLVVDDIRLPSRGAFFWVLDMYRFGSTSLKNLENVHPDLVRLCNRVIKRSRFDFGISSGLRTYEEQVQLFRDKKTTILESLHLPQEDGVSHAVDIFPYINGKSNYSKRYFGPILQTFITESIIIGVQVEFGGLWQDPIDYPHIQLNQRFY